ncbi:MAG TPA: hypothetical protein VJ278_01925, partial [Chthoniobacterales bacterium]|nr:hypothetical protein [Chthoniobacterales bacterium]
RQDVAEPHDQGMGINLQIQWSIGLSLMVLMSFNPQSCRRFLGAIGISRQLDGSPFFIHFFIHRCQFLSSFELVWEHLKKSIFPRKWHLGALEQIWAKQPKTPWQGGALPLSYTRAQKWVQIIARRFACARFFLEPSP